MKIGNIELKWLGHSGFLIINSKKIYIDPYNIPETSEKADLILITHSHYDHCSFEDINKIIQEGTRIVMPADCQSKITRFETKIKMEVIEQGQELDLGDLKISAVPAYNIDKQFHPREKEWVGYIININGKKVYHAGDTDLIPEMEDFGDVDIAILPIGGTYTMDVTEAIQAVHVIEPKIAIPMHYGKIIGTKDDADKFKELSSSKVEILTKE